ncbi:hypothetical protein ACRE1S_03240 [Helicobacter himalayensis]|uniref:hypothetical protein n=1 Tax=Helicobacter himalayensis TaxID=1591088 RepID=UPI003D6F330E
MREAIMEDSEACHCAKSCHTQARQIIKLNTAKNLAPTLLTLNLAVTIPNPLLLTLNSPFLILNSPPCHTKAPFCHTEALAEVSPKESKRCLSLWEFSRYR